MIIKSTEYHYVLYIKNKKKIKKKIKKKRESLEFSLKSFDTCVVFS
jgi:hypothetical protein